MRCKALLGAPAFLAVAFMAFGGIASLAAAAPSPSPNPIPAMALYLTPSGVTAEPTNVKVGVATISGSLVMDKIPGERLIANLKGTTDRGWPVQISPSNLVFQNNKASAFSVTVAVPVATSANQVGLVTVEADAMSNTNAFRVRSIAQALITVAPYYVFYINSPMPFKEITPAKTVVFDVEIDNWGNSEDSYEISIQNQEELAQKGWTVSLSTSTAMRVGAMQAKYLKMTVQPAFTSTFYKTESTVIFVQGRSLGSVNSIEEKTAVLPFIVYERGTYLDPAFTGFSVGLLLLIGVPSGIAIRKFYRHFRPKKPVPDEEPEE